MCMVCTATVQIKLTQISLFSVAQIWGKKVLSSRASLVYLTSIITPLYQLKRTSLIKLRFFYNTLCREVLQQHKIKLCVRNNLDLNLCNSIGSGNQIVKLNLVSGLSVFLLAKNLLEHLTQLCCFFFWIFSFIYSYVESDRWHKKPTT